MGAKGFCYLVLFKEEGERFTAKCLDLPDCIAEGATFEEAKQHIIVVMSSAVRSLIEKNILPPPSLDFEDYRYSWPELSGPHQTGMGILFYIEWPV